jgi:hypothetical protein
MWINCCVEFYGMLYKEDKENKTSTTAATFTPTTLNIITDNDGALNYC